MTASEPVGVDLRALLAAASGRGVQWSAPRGLGLNVNLAILPAGASIEAHRVDVAVLFVGLRGSGELLLDGSTLPFGEGRAAVVPAGVTRSLRAEVDLSYLTVHPERPGPVVGGRRTTE